MRHFNIVVRSFHEIQEFVALAMVQPFEVLVGTGDHKINGKALMGMTSLDHSQPQQVSIVCSEEEFLRFRKEAARFVV